MDTLELAGRLPPKKMLTLRDYAVGVVHGWGPPEGIRKRIRERFFDVDIILYGHSHQPFAGHEDGIFFFNPGSAASGRFQGTATCGLLHLGREIRAEILPL
jgi:hypothetical protein